MTLQDYVLYWALKIALSDKPALIYMSFMDEDTANIKQMIWTEAVKEANRAKFGDNESN